MEAERKERIRKPEGVFILSLLVFLNFGVYQFFNDFTAMRQSENETPLLIAILLISLDVFSAAAAIWAFFGDNTGRIALLILISVNLLWSVFVLIIAVSYNNFDEVHFLFLFSLLKPLFLFGLCWWYFTRKDVVAYYKQDNQYEFF
jgi:MFS family permease